MLSSIAQGDVSQNIDRLIQSLEKYGKIQINLNKFEVELLNEYILLALS